MKSFFTNVKYLAEKFYRLLESNLGRRPSAFELAKHTFCMIFDNLRYHATFSDYFDLQFYRKNAKEKAEYITAKDARKFALFVDGEDKVAFYASKTNMYKALADYVGRDQLFLPEASFDEFERFLKKHPRFLFKPDNLEGGYGISVIDSDGEDTAALYEKLKVSPAVLDELIEQAPEMRALCPQSVNTVRIFSLRIGREIRLMFPLLRMGDGSKVVDNFYSGGLISTLDIDTGKTIYSGVNSRNEEYEYHPLTNVQIKGFQVPRWDALKAFVLDCAEHFDLDYVAWDIAIREHDFVVIEANPNGGNQAPQMAGASGQRKQFELFRQQIEEYRKQGAQQDGVSNT